MKKIFFGKKLEFVQNFQSNEIRVFLSYDIDSRCKMHLHDANFPKIEFLLPPEYSTIEISEGKMWSFSIGKTQINDSLNINFRSVAAGNFYNLFLRTFSFHWRKKKKVKICIPR